MGGRTPRGGGLAPTDSESVSVSRPAAPRLWRKAGSHTRMYATKRPGPGVETFGRGCRRRSGPTRQRGSDCRQKTPSVDQRSRVDRSTRGARCRRRRRRRRQAGGGSGVAEGTGRQGRGRERLTPVTAQPWHSSMAPVYSRGKHWCCTVTGHCMATTQTKACSGFLQYAKRGFVKRGGLSPELNVELN